MKILIITQRGRAIRLRVWNRLLLNGVAAHVLAHAICREAQLAQGHKWQQEAGRLGGAANSMVPQHSRPEPDQAKQRARRETARVFRRLFRAVRGQAMVVRRAGGDPLVEFKSRSGMQVTVAL